MRARVLAAAGSVAGLAVTGAVAVSMSGGANAATPELKTTAPATVTTLDLAGGTNLLADTSSGFHFASQALANAAYSVKVTSRIGGALTMHVDSYTPPTGVSPTGARMWFAQGSVNSSNAPNTAGSWREAQVAGQVTIPKAHRHATDAQYLTANKPGTWTVTFRDDQGTAGTDDDATATVRVRVLDVGLTPEVLIDDWTPAVTAPALAAKRDPITATVDLTGVDSTDARGATGGYGILRTAIANLTGVGFTGSASPASASPWLDADLRGAKCTTNDGGVLTPAASDCGLRSEVTNAGQRGVLADATRHAPGTVTASAGFDTTGNGSYGFGLGAATTRVVSVIPGHITLAASPNSVVGAKNVTVSGAVPTPVNVGVVTVTGAGTSRDVAVNPVTGGFSSVFTVRSTTTFRASTPTATSDPVRVTVTSVVTKFAIAAKGKGVIAVSLTGGPRGGGRFELARDGRALGTYSAPSTGILNFKVTGQPKGTHKYTVTYTSPGARTSAPAAATVKVS